MDIRFETDTPSKLKNVLNTEPILEDNLQDNMYARLMTFIEKDSEGVLFSKLDEENNLEKILPDIKGLKVVGRCYYHADPAYVHMNRVYKLFQQFLNEGMAAENFNIELFRKPLSEYLKEKTIIKDSLKSEILGNGSDLKFKCGTYAALAAFCHDIGKYKSYKKQGEKVSFHGHDRAGARLMEEFCRGNNFPKEAEKMIVNIVEGHMYPLSLFNSNLKDANKSYIKFFEKYTIYVPFILGVSICDMYGKSLNPTKENEKEVFKAFIENLYRYFKEYAKM